MSPIDFIKKPSSWLKALSKYRCTVCAAPNFAFDLVCKKISKADLEALDLSSVIGMLCGAEPLRPEVASVFIEVIDFKMIKILICTLLRSKFDVLF